MLLNAFDLVLVGSPVEWQIIQTNVWAFRRNAGTIAFSHRWRAHAAEMGAAESGRDAEMGRAKVPHFGGLRPQRSPTLKERIEALVQHFPEMTSAFPLYVELARREAERLGQETLADPVEYRRERSYRAAAREDRVALPDL